MEDAEVIRKEFVQLLRDLTTSKESISKATKIMVENINHSEELFNALMKRLKKTVQKRRLPLFYLLDSVCQVTKNKSQKEYRELVAKSLNDIVGLIVPEEGAGASRDKALSVVIKVLGLWKDRRVLGQDCIKRAKRRIEGDHNPKERQIVCVGMDIDAVQKQMEEDRRENKRSRWEGALRPANDQLGAEFDEMWDRFTKEEEFKKNFPESSFRNPHIRDPTRGRPPKGLSASTPSTSSTSPTSPNPRYSLSSPRDPSSASSPVAPSPSPPLSATPLYITPSDVNNVNPTQPSTPQTTPNNPPNDYVYFNRAHDRPFDYPDRLREWTGPRDVPLDLLEPRERELRERELFDRDRELRDRELRDRELRGEIPLTIPPIDYEPGYPAQHPVNIPPSCIFLKV